MLVADPHKETVVRLHPMLRVAATLVGITPFTTGCVGYMVGYGIDVSTTQVVVPTRSDSVDLKPGMKVRVFLKNGERVTARFRRVEPFPEEEYAARYGAARQTVAAESLWIPSLGATVYLLRENGDSITAEYLGVDFDGVLIRPAAQSQTRAEPAHGLTSVRVPGESLVTGGALDSLVTAGTLPVRSSLVLELSRKQEGRFALNAVARLERTGTTWRWVGSAVDAVTWIVVCIATCRWDFWSP